MKIVQIAAARELLRWTQADLAERARIDRRTVSNIETGKHKPNANTLRFIQRAFEAAGVEFVEGYPGVIMRGEPRRIRA